jgi:hypothetical protein
MGAISMHHIQQRGSSKRLKSFLASVEIAIAIACGTLQLQLPVVQADEIRRLCGSFERKGVKFL